jgi:SAM-dependent methyltransferase
VNAASPASTRTLVGATWATVDDTRRLACPRPFTADWGHAWIRDQLEAAGGVDGCILADLGSGVDHPLMAWYLGRARLALLVDLHNPGRDHPRAAVLRADLERPLPIPDASVDVVVSASVLEHLSERGRTLQMREIQRILRPGGRAVLTVSYLFPLDEHAVRTLARDPWLNAHGNTITSRLSVRTMLEACPRLHLAQPADLSGFPGCGARDEAIGARDDLLTMELRDSDWATFAPETNALGVRWGEIGLHLVREEDPPPRTRAPVPHPAHAAPNDSDAPREIGADPDAVANLWRGRLGTPEHLLITPPLARAPATPNACDALRAAAAWTRQSGASITCRVHPGAAPDAARLFDQEGLIPRVEAPRDGLCPVTGSVEHPRGAGEGPPVLVHVHIPKSAGLTVGRILREWFADAHLDLYSEHELTVFEPDRLGVILASAPGVRSIASHAIRRYPVRLAGRRALYFCMLRDPRQQFVSYLNFVQRRYDTLSAHHREVLPARCAEMESRDLAAWLIDQPPEIPFSNNYTARFLTTAAFHAAVPIAPGGAGDAWIAGLHESNLRDAAIAVLESMLFVGLTEDLPGSVEGLRARLRPYAIDPPAPSIGRVNVSREDQSLPAWLGGDDPIGRRVLESMRTDLDVYAWALLHLHGRDFPDHPAPARTPAGMLAPFRIGARA